MDFYKMADVRISGLQADIRRLSQVLVWLPEGTLHIVHNGKYIKFYNYRGTCIDGREMAVYISKKSGLTEAVRLWEKKFLEYVISEKQTEINDIRAFLTVREAHQISIQRECFEGEANQMLCDRGLAHIAGLLGYDCTDDEAVAREWKNDAYERSDSHPEHLLYEGPHGIMMRSKAETIIASELEKTGIPYRYECVHTVDGYRIAPDFMIRRPLDGQIIIWEHFGLWNRLDYRQTMYKKLETYARSGYCPGYNLIFSFETPEHPFVPSMAERMVQEYLV